LKESLFSSFVLASVVAVTGCQTTTSTGTPAPTPSPTATGTPANTSNIATTASEWTSVYNYDPGTFVLTFDATSGIVMAPPPPSVSTTSAMLLLANRTVTSPQQDFTLTVAVTTEQQLRTPTPNAWEVFWLFFNYKLASNHFKETNYFLVKPFISAGQPGGIELGRAYNEIDQVFLSTASTPKLTLGQKNEIKIVKRGQHLEAFVDQTKVLTFDGDVNDPGGLWLYDVPGEIGLYSEDAQVRISSVMLEN
jgi:hypothetical protein